MPEETIELLKQTLEEPPQSRMEESLYCAYIDGDLRQVSPRQIVWGEIRKMKKKRMTRCVRLA